MRPSATIFAKSARWFAGASIGLALACGGVAQAADCTVNAGAVSFGAYNPAAGAPNDARGDITVTCTCLVAALCVALHYHIEIQAGASNSTTSRKLLRAPGPPALGAAPYTDTLDYALYTDAGRTTAWGTGAGGLPVTHLLTLGDSVKQMYVYGRMPALQPARPGAYSEAPPITILY